MALACQWVAGIGLPGEKRLKTSLRRTARASDGLRTPRPRRQRSITGWEAYPQLQRSEGTPVHGAQHSPSSCGERHPRLLKVSLRGAVPNFSLVSQYGSTRSSRPLRSIHRRAGCVCLSMSVPPPSDGGSAHRLAFGSATGPDEKQSRQPRSYAPLRPITIHFRAAAVATELLFGLCQCSLGALAYQSGLKFGDRRHLLDDELTDGAWWDLRQITEDHAAFTSSLVDGHQERLITAKPIKLRHDKRCAGHTAVRQRLGQLRPRVVLSSFDFDIFV